MELLALLKIIARKPPLELERALLVGTEGPVHVADGTDGGSYKGIWVILQIC